MRSNRLLHAILPATIAVIATACPPQSGSGPSPTSIPPSTSTTTTSTTIPAPLSLVSGHEAPAGTGVSLPGGGSIIFFHAESDGAGPGLPGGWPIWQYTGSGPTTISADTATGGVPGFPSTNLLSNVAPGWLRATSTDTSRHDVVTASPLGLQSPTVLGVLPYYGPYRWAESWSPDGHYLAMVTDPYASTPELYIFDTYTFTVVRHMTLAAPPTLRDAELSHPAWTPDSTKVLIGTTVQIEVVAVAGPEGDATAPWPVSKPCGVSDVSVEGRVAVLCSNGVGYDLLFNLFTQAFDGTDSRLVISPTLTGSSMGTKGISPHAVFSPDGQYLALNLNTLSGILGTRGVLAVVPDEPLAAPVVLTSQVPSTTLDGNASGDAPMGWVATKLAE